MQNTPRLSAIDQFRGFAILLMILADFLTGVERVPPWLKHAPDVGYTLIDLIAPMFIFAIGLTYGLSFQRRFSRYGAKGTYEHFVTRYLALIGLGFLLTLGGNVTGIYPSTVNWGLLQAIGAAGLLALPVIRLPAGWRAVVGLSLLVAYQFLLDRYWLSAVILAPHNGPWGALSWGALLILSTALADLYHAAPQTAARSTSASGGIAIDNGRGRAAYPWVAVGALVAGIALAVLVPVSKHRASASYVLISLGLSALIFYAFHLLDERAGLRSALLEDWGRNPLLLYLLHGVLIGIFVLPGIPAWHEQAQAWLVAIQAAILVAVLSWIARALNRRRIYFTM